MLSLETAIAVGGGKQPLNERRPSLAKFILFENRCGSISRWRGGGGGHLCEILAKWGGGVGVNPRGYGKWSNICHHDNHMEIGKWRYMYMFVTMTTTWK